LTILEERQLRRQRTARLVAGTALIAAALAAPVSAAAAPATPPPAGLAITHIHCIETEDITGADDAYLKVPGGPVLWGPKSLNDGESADLRVTVHTGQAIELWDDDVPDADDLLGTNTIGGPGIYKYNQDGADYDVTVSAV
jgi:hypothetical protein